MSLYNKIILKKEKLSLIRLGYVGLPIAVSFAKYIEIKGLFNRKEYESLGYKYFRL